MRQQKTAPCRTQAKPELSFAAWSWDSQAWKNTRMHFAPCNGFCRCAGPDSPVLNMASAIQKSFIKFAILLFFIPISLSHWSGWPQNALSLFLMLPLKASSYYPFLPPSSLAFNSSLQLIYHVWASWRLYAGCPCSACFRKRCLPLNLIFFI